VRRCDMTTGVKGNDLTAACVRCTSIAELAPPLLLARIESHEPGLVLAADAAGAKRADVGADLLEGAGEGFDFVVG